jgi:SAM-dependent methyltransferase
MTLRKEIGRAAFKLAQWGYPEKFASWVPDADQISYGEVGYRDAKRSGWYRSETQELLAGFPILPSDAVADIGCGSGGNSLFCAKFAASVIAVDIDPGAVASLETRFRNSSVAACRAVVSDGNPLPIESGAMDKVICTEVLEHVDDPRQFLTELVRIGKAGALYLLSVPDSLSETVLKRVSPPASYIKPNHIRIIERNEFGRLASDAGLVVQKRLYYSFYWSVWNALVWQCGIDFDRGRHPALDHWAHAWNAVLDLPHGDVCKSALDDAMPKSQVIIAYKK